MKMHKLVQLGMLATIVASTGCASIVSRSKWPVAFKSEPPGAEVVIKDDSGKEIHHGITPVTFTLRSSEGYFQSGNYQVCMKMPGYQEDKGVVKANLNGWYVGNIGFGGLIGLIVVDPLTGAMWRLPGEYDVNLVPNSAVSERKSSISEK